MLLQFLSKVINETSEEVLGKKRTIKNENWFDKECKNVVDKRNRARRKMLQRETRLNHQKYAKERRATHVICRKKKREAVKKDNGNGKRLFRWKRRRILFKSKESKKGFRPKLCICTIPRNNENTDDSQSYDADNNLNDNEDKVEPSYPEIVAIMKKLKNNKAPQEDISAELIKYGGAEMWKMMHSIINSIREKEQMPKNWNVGIICPLHKKRE
ncbi:line-1 retrotransposon-like protein [Lasius niger]|uniref:Line-1 retrotransposon-like protein n=1 Tax=Lasius niger TaxID=67767 RepID=A0A0J7K4S0_LASNI|nr:line-1 retrotransposon-like protein [Lasius niger]